MRNANLYAGPDGDLHVKINSRSYRVVIDGPRYLVVDRPNWWPLEDLTIRQCAQDLEALAEDGLFLLFADRYLEKIWFEKRPPRAEVFADD